MTGKLGRTAERVACDHLTDVPHDRGAAKVRGSWAWWTLAAIAQLVAIAPIGLALWLAVNNRELPLVLLGLSWGVPQFVALFGAHQASREGTSATLAAIVRFGRGARGVVKGNTQ